MAHFQLRRTQTFDQPLDTIWEFISRPENLKTITPDYMGFDITSQVPEEMYEGLIISYRLSPLRGIKTTWVTEITHIKDKAFFVDEQRMGPYKMWHHQHHLLPKAGKIEMTDIVTYIPPMGALGAVANRLFIKKMLNDIFDYRYQALEKLFD